MSSILISFVLPAYKRRFLKSAIESILQQTYTDFELIIVNDRSPEDLDSITLSYADSRIKYYINSENIGGRNLIEHWNNCINYASGEYLILASDDDLYHPNYLSEMIDMINHNPDKNLFGCRKRIINENNELIDVDGYLNENMSQIDFVYRLFSKFPHQFPIFFHVHFRHPTAINS